MSDSESTQHILREMQTGFSDVHKAVWARDEHMAGEVRSVRDTVMGFEHQLKAATARLDQLSLIVMADGGDKAIGTRLALIDSRSSQLALRIEDAEKEVESTRREMIAAIDNKIGETRKEVEAVKAEIASGKKWLIATIGGGMISCLSMLIIYVYEKLFGKVH